MPLRKVAADENWKSLTGNFGYLTQIVQRRFQPACWVREFYLTHFIWPERLHNSFQAKFENSNYLFWYLINICLQGAVKSIMSIMLHLYVAMLDENWKSLAGNFGFITQSGRWIIQPLITLIEIYKTHSIGDFNYWMLWAHFWNSNYFKR